MHWQSAEPSDESGAALERGDEIVQQLSIAKYALVVGDTVYTLETSDQAALDKLNNLAGAKAKITGDVDGTTITVKSVVAGS